MLLNSQVLHVVPVLAAHLLKIAALISSRTAMFHDRATQPHWAPLHSSPPPSCSVYAI